MARQKLKQIPGTRGTREASPVPNDLRLPSMLLDFIRSEKLKPHQAFLSRREVSERFQVSLTRVHEVFNVLEERGVLYSLPRKGTFVSPVVRHREILVVTGETPRHALSLGGVVEFLGGCQEAMRVQNLPYGMIPISWQEIAGHLGDFTIAFPRVAGLVFFRRISWLQDFQAVAANRSIPSAFYGSDTWLSRLAGAHRLVYEEQALLNPIVDHLLERGHRRIVFAGRGGEIVDRRKHFFLERLAHHGIPAPREELRYDLAPDPAGRNGEMERRLRELKDAPTAIVCAEDQTAILVEHALVRLGKRVPQDCAVTGIDNASYSRDAVVPITTVEIPVFEDAQRLLSSFVEAIDEGLHARPVHLASRPGFIPRESTAGKS